MDNLFYKLPQGMVRASGFVSKVDGSFVSLTSNSKIIYTYMLHRHDFFVGKSGGEHFETQVTIGDACGIESRTVMRIMKVFKDHKMIDSILAKANGTGYARYSYKSIDRDPVLWIGKGEGPKVIIGDNVEPVTREKPEAKAVKHKHVIDTPQELWEDEFLDGLGG